MPEPRRGSMHWADLDPSRGREQVRTIARERLVGEAGWVDRETMEEVSLWLRDFLSLP